MNTFWVTVVAVVLLPAVAVGQSLPPMPYLQLDPPELLARQPALVPPGDDRIELVRQGEQVPFTGQLFDSHTALRWANRLVQLGELRAVDYTALTDWCQVQVDHQVDLRNADRALAHAVSTDLKARLLQLEQRNADLANPPFWENPWFAFAMGVVVTGVVGGLGVWGISSLD